MERQLWVIQVSVPELFKGQLYFICSCIFPRTWTYKVMNESSVSLLIQEYGSQNRNVKVSADMAWIVWLGLLFQIIIFIYLILDKHLMGSYYLLDSLLISRNIGINKKWCLATRKLKYPTECGLIIRKLNES